MRSVVSTHSASLLSNHSALAWVPVKPHSALNILPAAVDEASEPHFGPCHYLPAARLSQLISRSESILHAIAGQSPSDQVAHRTSFPDDPQRSIAAFLESPHSGGRNGIAASRLEGHESHAVESNQAGYCAEPEVAVGGLREQANLGGSSVLGRPGSVGELVDGAERRGVLGDKTGEQCGSEHEHAPKLLRSMIKRQIATSFLTQTDRTGCASCCACRSTPPNDHAPPTPKEGPQDCSAVRRGREAAGPTVDLASQHGSLYSITRGPHAAVSSRPTRPRRLTRCHCDSRRAVGSPRRLHTSRHGRETRHRADPRCLRGRVRLGRRHRILQGKGYEVSAVQNPLSSYAADIETTKRLIDAQTGPTVVVAHSYGGAVMTAAAAGNPNVKALVYLAAFANDVNEPLSARSSRSIRRRPSPRSSPIPPAF